MGRLIRLLSFAAVAACLWLSPASAQQVVKVCLPGVAQNGGQQCYDVSPTWPFPVTAVESTGLYTPGLATQQRAANTSSYSAGQILCNSAGACSNTIQVSGTAGTSGILANVWLIKSTTTTTNATFRAHFFTSAPTVAGLSDGSSYAAPNIADTSYVGYEDFVAPVASASGTFSAGAPSQALLKYVLASGSKSLFYTLEVTGSYAPGSGEIFTLTTQSTP